MTERQAEIIETSINLIATKGIQGLTIKNLSKEIGISEPAIYRHFESKTDILLAILKNFEEMSSFMDAAMSQFADTAMAKIEFMFSKIVDIFIDEPSHISVVFSEEVFKNEKVLKNRIVEIMEAKVKTIERIILEGQEKNEIRTDIDHKTLAMIVVGTLRFMIKQWDLKNQHHNLKVESKNLIKGLKTILTP
ncbi:MAG: TetR/AcrR family transcriptional regulator [Bacteroidales bacterium]|nr:TetR/AcrR family transcriptional regulator [Bacteroidales bacterium]